jgi:Mce-associated membrane protein
MLPKQPASADPVDPEPLETPPPDQPVADGPAAAPATEPVDPVRARQVRRLTVLGVAAVLLLAAAGLLAFGNHEARSSGVLANHALVDADGTAEVVSQLTAAIKTVYSYDYRSLDKTEADAKQLITGEFAGEFDRMYAPLKQEAPKQQTVLNTEVPTAGVMQLSGDRARVLMMVDQRGTYSGNQPLPPVTARLVVEAQRVDGRWLIAKVTNE